MAARRARGYRAGTAYVEVVPVFGDTQREIADYFRKAFSDKKLFDGVDEVLRDQLKKAFDDADPEMRRRLEKTVKGVHEQVKKDLKDQGKVSIQNIKDAEKEARRAANAVTGAWRNDALKAVKEIDKALGNLSPRKGRNKQVTALFADAKRDIKEFFEAVKDGSGKSEKELAAMYANIERNVRGLGKYRSSAATFRKEEEKGIRAAIESLNKYHDSIVQSKTSSQIKQADAEEKERKRVEVEREKAHQQAMDYLHDLALERDKIRDRWEAQALKNYERREADRVAIADRTQKGLRYIQAQADKFEEAREARARARAAALRNSYDAARRAQMSEYETPGSNYAKGNARQQQLIEQRRRVLERYRESIQRTIVDLGRLDSTDTVINVHTAKARNEVARIKAVLEKFDREEYDVDLDMDLKDWEAQQAKIKADLTSLRNADLDLDVNDKEVIAELAKIRQAAIQLEKQMDDIMGPRDAAQFIARLRAIKTEASRIGDIKIKAVLADEQANAQLDRLKAKTRDLANEEIDIDVDLNPEQVAAEVARIEALLDSIEDEDVFIDIDNEEAQAKLANFRAILDEVSKRRDVLLRTDVDQKSLQALRQELRRVTMGVHEIHVQVADEEAQREINNLKTALETLKDKTVGVDISEKEAMANIRVIENALERLDRMNVDVDVDIDINPFEFAAAHAAIATLKANANSADREVNKLSRSIRNAGVSLTDTTQAFRLFSPILAGVAILIAPIAASIGALTMSLGGLVAMLPGVAGGVAAVAFGLTGMEEGFKANEKLQEAQKKALDGTKESAEALAEAQKEYAQAIKELGPAAGEWIQFLDKAGGKMRTLQRTAREGFLPGLIDGLDTILNKYAGPFNSFLDTTSRKFGDLAKHWGDLLTTPEAEAWFSRVADDSVKFIDDFAGATENFAEGLAHLTDAFRPIAHDISEWLLDFSQQFNEWAAGLAESETFQELIVVTREIMPLLGRFLYLLGAALMNLAIAAAPLAVIFFDIVNWVLEFVAALDPDWLTLILGLFVGLTIALMLFSGIIAGAGAIMALVAAGMTKAFIAVVGVISLVIGGIIILTATLLAFGDDIDSAGSKMDDSNDKFLGFKDTLDDLKDAFDDFGESINRGLDPLREWYEEHAEEIIQTFDEFFASLIDGADSLAEGLAPVIRSLGGFFEDVLGPMFAWIMEYLWPVFSDLLTFFGDLMQIGMNVMGFWGEILGKYVIPVVTNVFRFFSPLIELIMEWAGLVYEFMISPLLEFFSVLSGDMTVQEWAENAYQDMKDAWDDVVEVFSGIPERMDEFFASLGTWWEDGWNNVKQWWSDFFAFAWVGQWGALLALVLAKVLGWFAELRLWWEEKWNDIKDFFKVDFGEALNEDGTSILGTLKGNFRTNLSEISTNWRERFSGMRDWFANTWAGETVQNLIDFGIRMLYHLISGLVNMRMEWIARWNGIKSWFKDTFTPGQASDTRGWLNGLHTWLGNKLTSVAATWAGRWARMRSMATEAFGKIRDSVGRIMGEIGEKIQQYLVNPFNKVVESLNLSDSLKINVDFSQSHARGGHIKLADGGVMPGYTPGRDVHTFYSPTGGILELSGGEPVLRPEVGRVLGTDWVNNINQAARSGGVNRVKKVLGLKDGGHTKLASGGFIPRTSAGIVQLGRFLQGLGIRVGEHPAFGRVGRHSPNSWHYRRGALDLNTAPGQSRGEQAYFDRLAPILHALGWGVIWRYPGHYGHLHVDIGNRSLGNFRRGVNKSDNLWDMLKSMRVAGGGGFGLPDLFDISGSVSGWLDKLKGVIGKGRLPETGFGAAKKLFTSIAKEKASEFFTGFGGEGGDAPGGVQRWAGVVEQALRMLNQPTSPSIVQMVLRRMNQESGGNPRAINNWDINARRGTPSKGLMQVINPTFRRYMMPGYGNIWSPLDNILASMRYAIARYGSLAAAYNRRGGYAQGGIIDLLSAGGMSPILRDRGGALPRGLSLVMNGLAHEETIIPATPDEVERMFTEGPAGGGYEVDQSTHFHDPVFYADPRQTAQEIERMKRLYNPPVSAPRLG